MAENLKTLDINQFPKATEIKDDDTLLLIRPSANGKVKPMRVDGNLVPNAADLATKANASDVLLAEDTAALVADAKRDIIEGKKITVLTSTQVTSDFKFNKDINLDEGELHIKVHVDTSGNYSYVEGDFKFCKDGIIGFFHNKQEKMICMTVNLGAYNVSEDIVDNQFEIIIRRDLYINYTTGGINKTLDNIKANLPIQISNDYVSNEARFSLEIFQIQRLKTSQLDDDCGYVKLEGDITNINSILQTKTIQFQYTEDDYNNDRTYDAVVLHSIMPHSGGAYYDNVIAKRKGGYIFLSKDAIKIYKGNLYGPIPYDDDNSISLNDIISICEKPIYKIVNSLPTSDIDSRNIYMIKKTNPTDPNIKYDKYIYISEDSAWEKIG